MTDPTQIDSSTGGGPVSASALVLCAAMVVQLLTFVCVPRVTAQSEESVQKIETELAAFEVTAVGKDGKAVSGLTERDFKIFENGIERPIDFFQPITNGGERRPLLIVFALDVSGSMTAPELDRLRTAMNEFIKRLSDPSAYFAAVTFAMTVKTIQDFTNRPEGLERSLAKIRKNEDGLSTHAYDAIDDAVRLISRKAPRSISGRAPKRAVVVITDGFPVGDVVSPATVIERANEAKVSVFSVILPSFLKSVGSKRPLLTPFESSDLVTKTGGISMYASERNLEPLFTALAERIATSYGIAIYPDEEKLSPGEFRNVRIESTRGYNIVQNRPGYRLSKP